MAAIEKLRVETVRWLEFHEARGVKGRIEALACIIRLQALEECLRILKREAQR